MTYTVVCGTLSPPTRLAMTLYIFSGATRYLSVHHCSNRHPSTGTCCASMYTCTRSVFYRYSTRNKLVKWKNIRQEAKSCPRRERTPCPRALCRSPVLAPLDFGKQFSVSTAKHTVFEFPPRRLFLRSCVRATGGTAAGWTLDL